MLTKDIDIRQELHHYISTSFLHDKRVVDELDICRGIVRADVAVIDNYLHGFEIKSDKDSLVRLQNQIDHYSKVFDRVTIVTGETHLEKIMQIVPNWWGVLLAQGDTGAVKLSSIRETQPNEQVDVLSLLELIWKEEALSLLTEHGLQRGYISKPKQVIRERIAECFSFKEIHSFVVRQLKVRDKWRN